MENNTLLINIQTLTKRHITQKQAAKLKAAMNQGSLQTTWDEAVDFDGDICLDNTDYAQAIKLLKE